MWRPRFGAPDAASAARRADAVFRFAFGARATARVAAIELLHRDFFLRAARGKRLYESRCIGCHSCSVACKSEHDVPAGGPVLLDEDRRFGVHVGVDQFVQRLRDDGVDGLHRPAPGRSAGR